MENDMNPSSQSTVEKNNVNLIKLKSKLQSLEESFKNNPLYITSNEIDEVKNNTLHTKITAWNWSRSFAED
ncbi:darobactin family peptide antibiotic [Yersinia similis]|nr:darobactin family peptide antibiotic [Yersinia similis]